MPLMWSVVEPELAIISANLPLVRPIAARCAPGFFRSTRDAADYTHRDSDGDSATPGGGSSSGDGVVVVTIGGRGGRALGAARWGFLERLQDKRGWMGTQVTAVGRRGQEQGHPLGTVSDAGARAPRGGLVLSEMRGPGGLDSREHNMDGKTSQESEGRIADKGAPLGVIIDVASE